MEDTLEDLNKHLFDQIRRLNNPELKGMELVEERGRSNSIVSVAKAITDNAALVLEGEKWKEDKLTSTSELPPMFTAKTRNAKIGMVENNNE